MKRLWPWAMLVAGVGVCVAAAPPRAADDTSLPITIGVTGATSAQIECTH